MSKNSAAQRTFSSEFLPGLAEELANSKFTPSYVHKTELQRKWRQIIIASQEAVDFLILFAKTFIHTRKCHLESYLNALIGIIADHYAKFFQHVYPEKTQSKLTAELVSCMKSGNSIGHWNATQHATTHHALYAANGFGKLGQQR